MFVQPWPAAAFCLKEGIKVIAWLGFRFLRNLQLNGELGGQGPTGRIRLLPVCTPLLPHLGTPEMDPLELQEMEDQDARVWSSGGVTCQGKGDSGRSM